MKAALLAALFAGTAALAAPPTRPNVILILADDLGYECLGTYGGTSYRTPNLDQLAAGGVRFDRAYAQPLCTPTRVQLMTGQYNIRNYFSFGQMDPEATTFAHLFRQAGYATCIVGKWQLGRDVALPGKLGFDEHCLWQLTRRLPRYANPSLEINGVEHDYTGGEYGPDLCQDYALDFIRRKKDAPFFLYYPLLLTHGPYQPTPHSPDWDPKATGEGMNRDGKHFGEMVAYMDHQVGKLLAQLDALGIRENTLVLFLSDNGTGLATQSRLGARTISGGKGKTTDAGMHVPLIANWPGTVPAGRACADLVDTTDFLPTLIETARLEKPAGLPLDGRSFFPQLRGEQGRPRDWYYSWYSPHGDMPSAREFAATARYKLYRTGEFFDTERDREERHAVATAALTGEAAAAAELLRAALAQFADARPEKYRNLPRRRGGDKEEP